MLPGGFEDLNRPLEPGPLEMGRVTGGKTKTKT